MSAWEPRKIAVLDLPPHAAGIAGTRAGVGDRVDVSLLKEICVQYQGGMVGTLVVEGSTTGGSGVGEWLAIANDFNGNPNFTAAGFNSNVPLVTVMFLRVNVTAWVSGVPVTKICGTVR